MSAGPPLQPGRRERRRLATRRALLDAALELIDEHGVYATRVEDVTARADVGKGVFYNYFDSKTALVASLLIDSAEILERDYLSRSPSALLVERLESAVLAHERFFKEHPARALLMHQARGLLEMSKEPEPVLRDAFEDYLRRLGHFLFPGQQGSGLLEQATLVAGVIAGHRSFSKAAGIQARSRQVVDLLVRGLEPAPKRRST